MMARVIYIFAYILTQVAVIASAEQEDIKLQLETSTGPIRGKVVTGLTQKEARAFFGIPYAEPPVGKLRFRPPLQVKPWTRVLDATRAPLPCYQQYTGHLRELARETGSTVRRPWSEDCLTLNVWTPAVTPEDAPVFVYVHGGGFATGSGAFPYFEMSTFSTEAEIVIVTFNYRLGAFGFLSLGTSEVPGNCGLMDQQLALRWAHKNAPVFGGKSDAVFFQGIGVGAASVGHHIISKSNAGLFKTGIMNGGSAACTWAWQTKEIAVRLGKELSRYLDCDVENATTELECLQCVHPEDVVDTVSSITKSDIFKPNVDGSFIKESPVEAMKAGRFNNVTMVVFNAEKDVSLWFQIVNKDILMDPHPTLDEKSFEEAMRRTGLVHTRTELEVVKEWYFSKGRDMNGTEIRDAAVNAYSEGLTICCTDDFLKYASENGALIYKIVMDIPDLGRPLWIGAHGQMSYAVLSAEVFKPELNSSAEVKLGLLDMHHRVKNYARKRAKEFEEFVPIYNLEERPYLHWGEKMVNRKNFRREECILWSHVIPALRRGRRTCSDGR